ncbi:hypothetical protein D3A95_01180 [Thermosynechococcus sichuanensis E542]|uniref:Uncharacterized protein n=1 Tax=Thermosynechococcus sichuanensis E542 TaxID=2016101 RepID=A0A3B7M9I3_9CYAN|nr:hypothetical protein [Thermosynechococcus vestitus]AXY67283.2 hypothetical protein D3A95_01180 [Thermosynechococcus vestitus E542]
MKKTNLQRVPAIAGLAGAIVGLLLQQTTIAVASLSVSVSIVSLENERKIRQNTERLKAIQSLKNHLASLESQVIEVSGFEKVQQEYTAIVGHFKSKFEASEKHISQLRQNYEVITNQLQSLLILSNQFENLRQRFEDLQNLIQILQKNAFTYSDLNEISQKFDSIEQTNDFLNEAILKVKKQLFSIDNTVLENLRQQAVQDIQSLQEKYGLILKTVNNLKNSLSIELSSLGSQVKEISPVVFSFKDQFSEDAFLTQQQVQELIQKTITNILPIESKMIFEYEDIYDKFIHIINNSSGSLYIICACIGNTFSDIVSVLKCFLEKDSSNKLHVAFGYQVSLKRAAVSNEGNNQLELYQLRQNFPQQVNLQIMKASQKSSIYGTHAKFIVGKDVALIGIYNFLNRSKNVQEAVIETRNRYIIQELVEGFKKYAVVPESIGVNLRQDP